MNVNHSELCFEKGHFLVNDFFLPAHSCVLIEGTVF